MEHIQAASRTMDAGTNRLLSNSRRIHADRDLCGCNHLTDLAVAEAKTKPAELVGAAGRGMSFGFVGLMSTIVPTILALVALGRKLPPLRQQLSQEPNHVAAFHIK